MHKQKASVSAHERSECVGARVRVREYITMAEEDFVTSVQSTVTLPHPAVRNRLRIFGGNGRGEALTNELRLLDPAGTVYQRGVGL